MTAVTEQHDRIEIELDCVTGVVTLVGTYVPPVTTWSLELIDIIRRGGSLWCSINGDVIEMRIQPETLWYRLTGEIDNLDGVVAERCNADGTPWTGEVTGGGDHQE